MNIIDAKIQRPTHDQIAKRAYELYQRRGCKPGCPAADWQQAETELLQLAATQVTSAAPCACTSATPKPVVVNDRAAGKRTPAVRMKKISLS